VVSASAFGQFTSIAPGSWIEIYGSNLAADSRSWATTDFSGVNAPTSLDGTKVTVGGQAAFIDYISPGQVNAQVPSSVGTGPQSIVVTTASGSSAPYTITVNLVEPGLLAPSSFNIAGKQNVAALFSDGVTYVLPPGSISGITSRRAQPGDAITLYGVGFGPVTPSIPAGQIVQASNSLALPLQLMFGSTPATFTFGGLAPNAVGLYQFNVTVPNVASSDAVPLTSTVGGFTGAQTLYIAVQNSATLPQVQSVTLLRNSVAPGGTVQGTVTLSSAAPAGGVVVALASNQSAATVPATVTVPAGSTLATFTITAGNVSSNQTATITASYGGNSAETALTVFNYIDINATFTTGDETVRSEFGFSPSSVGVPYTDAVVLDLPFAESSGFASSPIWGLIAEFNSLAVTGQALTLSQVYNGAIFFNPGRTPYAVTAGSITFYLFPQGPSAGDVTGTFTLTTSFATVTGTILGMYQTQ
jgi:uncharacterized protein (TIGR03437 family)